MSEIIKNISLYGGTGFIGSKFAQIYPDSIVIPREERVPNTPDILYLISTVDNYNVFSNPFLDINTNLTVLIETLQACRARFGESFVFNFVSSWFVYGKTFLPASEFSRCNPMGFYSITKHAAEKLLESYCKTFGIKYRILRLCNVYGSGDKKASKKRNALQFLAGEVIAGRDINLYDEGKNIRDFLYVDDVCRAIRLVINKGATNEIYNIGSGQGYKFIDMMNYVKDKTKSPSNFVFVDPPDFHKVVQVKDMYLDTTRLKRLGFQPLVDIWHGLDMIIHGYE